jgi:hypothetical protein
MPLRGLSDAPRASNLRPPQLRSSSWILKPTCTTMPPWFSTVASLTTFPFLHVFLLDQDFRFVYPR